MMIYRCRWQVELLFKELKSDTNWRRFATGQQAIMEGLVWASLLALIIRRYIAMQSMLSVSVYKAGKTSMSGCYQYWRLIFIKHGRK